MVSKFKHLYSETIDHTTLQIRCVYNTNTDSIGIYTRFRRSRNRNNWAKNNKKCPLWLGDKAEIVLMNMFEEVKKMPTHNPGFDFLCGKGYKIDAKSSCLIKNSNSWHFHINRNVIADFFLCLAFDDRENLNPLHVWLIPGDIINHLGCLGIMKATLSKWSKYEKPLDKILTCCNTWKNNVRK